MTDLTILYYTASTISERFGDAVRAELIRTSGGRLPIVSVSQKPLAFGHNICVGPIGVSVVNVYRQILTGAREVKTRYTVCCEDDTLYAPEHFTYRPPNDTFGYSMQRWLLDPDPVFRYRDRTGMCVCLVETRTLIDALEVRFDAFPDPARIPPAQLKAWGEPGRYEKNLGLPHVSMEKHRPADPCVTFNHKPSLRGIRSKNPTDVLRDELPPWGKAKDLWERIHG